MQPFPLMLFSAGFGSRMGALTAQLPKPLIRVAGRALIDHALAQSDAAGVTRVVVNLHYRGAQIVAHLSGREVGFSCENGPILETGGGLRAALPLLGAGPVLVMNSDSVWAGPNPLRLLCDAWDATKMDALLLLLPVKAALGHGGVSDFILDVAADGAGRISRAGGGTGHVYIGAHITRTEGLAKIGEPAFSLNRLWDEMIVEGRLYGLVHQGQWCDVGSPESIALAEEMLRQADV